MAHDQPLIIRRAQRFAERIRRLAAIHHGAVRHTGKRRVAGAVGKQAGMIARLSARAHVGGHDCGDDVPVLLERGYVLPQRNIAFCLLIFERLEGEFLARVLEIFGGIDGRPAHDRRDLPHNVAQARIRRQMDLAAHAHADVRAVAAAQHAAVVDEQRFRAGAPRRKRHAHARHAAARDDQIIILFTFGDFMPVQRAAHLLNGRRIVRRRKAEIGGHIDRVAAAVKAGQIVQSQRVPPRAEINLARLLPCPCRAVRAQHSRKRLSVHAHVEAPRRRALAPDRRPVPRARQHRIAPRAHVDFRLRVGHGNAQTVRHDIGRTHLIHGLLIDRPAAQIFERLGFYKILIHGSLHPFRFDLRMLNPLYQPAASNTRAARELSHRQENARRAAK